MLIAFICALLSVSLLALSPARALDCPLLKDRSAKNWAALFTRSASVIFRGKIESLHFIGMDEQGFPTYSVGYQVLENIQGSLPPSFTADWTPWCDACTVEDATRDYLEKIGKEYLIQGRLLLDGTAWSFGPGMCWGIIDLPFRWADGDLLTSLRASAHSQQ